MGGYVHKTITEIPLEISYDVDISDPFSFDLAGF